MSVTHIGLVLDHLNAQPAVKLVALILADHADRDGICWPSYRRIAERSGLAQRSVRRHVRTLKERGVLDKVRSGSIVKSQGRTYRVSNAYRINADALAAMPLLVSTGPCEQLDITDHLEVATVGQTRWTRLTTKPSREPSIESSASKECG